MAGACRPHGTLVLAGLGHAGGQGSSAFSQSVLWAPSPVADVVSRELPMAMGRPELDALVEGFAAAAEAAVDAGLDGVELDAGVLSVLRQFHSGLTNQRTDASGADRLLVTLEVLDAVRDAVGPDRLVGLRLSCDELAPWAGVTPEQAAVQVGCLADGIDLLTVVRGGPYSATAYRPDAHSPAGFNLELCAAMRRAAGGRVPVVLQGSVVDPVMAAAALADGTADLVEMTRAQIADPRLVAKVRAGAAAHRAALHPLQPGLPGTGQPESPGELRGGAPLGARDGGRRPRGAIGWIFRPDPRRPGRGGRARRPRCARVLALQGHRVRVAERTDRVGGALSAASVGPGRERLGDLPAWLAAECARLGVTVDTGTEVTAAELDAARDAGTVVVLATGGTRHRRLFPGTERCPSWTPPPPWPPAPTAFPTVP